VQDKSPEGSGLRAGGREWIGLAVLALPTLLLALDISVLFLALPHLSTDLGAGSTQQLWIMDIYGFMIAGFLVTMGTLGDRIGRRKLLLIGASAFGIASVLAAYSVSAEMLIATRALLGIAGATLMPSTLALISNMFRDPKQRGVAIAVWMSCFAGGAALGSVGTAVYRSQVTVPAGVPAESAATARESLAGAVSAAGQLPTPLDAELLEGARVAFTTGLNTAAGVSTVLFVALAILAVALLRHVRPSGKAQHYPKEVPVQASD
jgi:MFS family permease